MKSSKYINIPAINNVIGNIYKNVSLLSQTDKYTFNEEDFPSSFHKITFSALYNLYQLGSKNITFEVLHDYFEQRPKLKAEFESNKGYEYLVKVSEISNEMTFNYYYQKMKKMTLFRAYEDLGLNLDWLYNPDNIMDTKKLQKQEEYIDNSSIEDIANLIDNKIDSIKIKYVQESSGGGCQIGEGVDELLESFKQTPALGYPLYGDYINTVSRGARLGKFFLRSAATGVGKTRTMIADACFIGCNQLYDLNTNKWITTGAPQSTLYIATEQDLEECQSMCIAYLAGIDEEHILRGEYYVGEWERAQKAAQILKNSKIQFECLPDFTMQMIENTIKLHIREHGVQYAFFDYIHSSASILLEVGGKGGVKGLREDNVLFLMSSKLKDIAVQYGVFVLSSTQLNAQYTDSETPDQNLLRGSKAIADRLDLGMIMLDTTKDDREKLATFCSKNALPVPNVKISVYKNRQGKHRGIYLWMNADKSTCRYNTIFVTDWNYNVIEMENIKIKVEEDSRF